MIYKIRVIMPILATYLIDETVVIYSLDRLNL